MSVLIWPPVYMHKNKFSMLNLVCMNSQKSFMQVLKL